ncbi:hypothetical protein Tco_1069824 [Tanacetum coccineum]|uniref:Uncharacterized protein n=1 Tax=Tanacetum coccineum TaxID=301880 RepID=A0ABQ5HLK6_9ASTR
MLCIVVRGVPSFGATRYMLWIFGKRGIVGFLRTLKGLQILKKGKLLTLPVKNSPALTKPLDEDDDIVVFENSETKEEDVKDDESDHNKERYTFEDDDDDEEFDDLD